MARPPATSKESRLTSLAFSAQASISRRGRRAQGGRPARYGLADDTVESVGRGRSTIEAHARLRDAIVADRVGLGLRAFV
jgi:hypothetical protein